MQIHALSGVTLVALLFAPAGASAERYRAALGAGGTYATRGSLWGGALAADVALTDGLTGASAETDAEWLISAVAEASFLTGTRDGNDLSQFDLLVGPRYTQVGYGTPWRVQPFVQALVGTVHEDSAGGNTALTGALGAGFDVPLGPLRGASRGKAVVLRAQFAEHWVNEDKTDWYGQWSVSLVARFTRSR